MHRHQTKSLFIAAALFLLFILLSIMVSFVDVQPIGPEHSKVGLATLNQFVFSRIGVHLLWYHMTDWLGVVVLLFPVFFALTGLFQLIKRKSLLKADPQILLLGLFYLLLIAAYLFFESFVINYRPVILHTTLEPSYPSSHTMIVIFIMITAIMEFHRLFPRRKRLLFSLDILSISLILLTVFGRLFSGVHWCTDIIAGLLLSLSFVMLYRYVVWSVSSCLRSTSDV